MFWGDGFSHRTEILDNWPSLRLTDASPAQSWTEPLTLPKVYQWLKLEYGIDADPAQDDELADMIVQARRQAEKFQNKDLVRKQWDMSMDYWLRRKISLREPLVSVDLVQYKDQNGLITTLTENVDYQVDKAKNTPMMSPMTYKIWPAFMPWPSSAVLIRQTSGYLPTDAFWTMDGAPVKRGMLYLISHWYDNRLPYTRGFGDIEEFMQTVNDLLSGGDAALRSEL